MPIAQRRRKTAAEWRVLIQEWERSGIARDAFAEGRGLVPRTLEWWRGELRRRDRLAAKDAATPRSSKSTAFLPVRVVEPAVAKGAVAVKSELSVDLVLDTGAVLRVPVGADVSWVSRLAIAVRGEGRC